MSELAKRGALLVADAAMAPPPIGSVRQRARRYRFRRRLRAGLVAVAVVAAAAGGVGWASVGSGPAPQALASADPLQALPAPATVRLPAGPARSPGKPGTWQLASYISEPASWSRNNSGPPGGALSCPQAGTCYLAASPGGGSSSGPGLPMSVLYVSRDGGLSWTAIRMPGDSSFTTELDCPTAGDCLAGGEVAGHGVLLSSSDGGYRWSYRSLPAGDGVIGELECPATASCRALASATGSPPAFGQAAAPTWFLATDDAGVHWTASTFPAGFTTSLEINALSCLSASACAVMGQGPGHPNTLHDPPADVLRTANGGRTWAAAQLPGGMSLVQIGAGPGWLTCAGTSTCYALAFTPQRGQEEGAAAVSTDGGATWRMLTLPPGTSDPELDSISCPSAADCWMAGGHDGSAMVLATRDTGAVWTATTFAAGRLAPGQQADSQWTVGEISCPTVSYCVAMGVADQGSDHTPVYTTAGG